MAGIQFGALVARRRCDEFMNINKVFFSSTSQKHEECDQI